MLAVIDYGAGNLRSVLHALNYLSVDEMRLVHTADEQQGADKIILPGVGAFGAGMQQLHRQALVEPLIEAVNAGVPYLGICLGMQFLFERSDEMGDHQGLGMLPGFVTRFPADMGLKVPHMGWNQLDVQRDCDLLRHVRKETSAYFVHSYYCVPEDPADVVAAVDYGIPFTAVVQHGRLYGVQFHPEKSQKLGLQVLVNFLELAS